MLPLIPKWFPIGLGYIIGYRLFTYSKTLAKVLLPSAAIMFIVFIHLGIGAYPTYPKDISPVLGLISDLIIAGSFGILTAVITRLGILNKISSTKLIAYLVYLLFLDIISPIAKHVYSIVYTIEWAFLALACFSIGLIVGIIASSQWRIKS